MPADRLINGRPLLFFRTYVGAALKAVQHDLMGPAGLRAVMPGPPPQPQSSPSQERQPNLCVCTSGWRWATGVMSSTLQSRESHGRRMTAVALPWPRPAGTWRPSSPGAAAVAAGQSSRRTWRSARHT